MDLNGKNILVTGGTGSFATHFIQHLLKQYQPNVIRIFSRDEHKQSQFLNQYGGIKGGEANFPVRGFIGDIRDLERLRMAMQGIDIVIHAAALKQVQSCEYNPFETVKTNILGSQNVIQAALDNNVEKVIAISTDKAVAPLNLYGSTKMVMEKLFINANSYRGNKRTKFCCTRYGNVADSRGTVVHIWRDQIKQGIPLSITSWDATRLWITMKEANQFVLECIGLMDKFDGGEIFCPRIPSVKVKTIFDALVPNSEYPFKLIGNRIGDKLHEDLILKEELAHTTLCDGKYVILPQEPSWKYHYPITITPNLSLEHNLTSGNNEKFLEVEEVKASLC